MHQCTHSMFHNKELRLCTSGITFTIDIVVDLPPTGIAIAPVPEIFLEKFANVKDDILEDVSGEVGEQVDDVILEEIDTVVIISTQNPTQSPTFSGLTAIKIKSDFIFDSSSREFCMQVMNFGDDRKFKMRPCSKKEQIRRKQEWFFEPDGQLRILAKPEWCASWRPNDKSLGLTRCDDDSHTNRRTTHFSYSAIENSLLVKNEKNGKSFRIGFNPRKKYDVMRLYRDTNTNNQSLYTFYLHQI